MTEQEKRQFKKLIDEAYEEMNNRKKEEVWVVGRETHDWLKNTFKKLIK